MQGPSWAYLAPITAVMQLPQWRCPDAALMADMTPQQRQSLWQPRVNELLGALAVASVFQLLLGATGKPTAATGDAGRGLGHPAAARRHR